jgi:hypothetical protein
MPNKVVSAYQLVLSDHAIEDLFDGLVVLQPGLCVGINAKTAL